LRTVEDAQHDQMADLYVAGHQPESGFSAERSQLYKSALWFNPDEARIAMDLIGVLLFSFVVLPGISDYNVAQ